MKLKTVITFSAKDVETLITKELQSQGYQVEDISIKISEKTEGSQRDPYTVPSLDEIDVCVTRVQPQFE